MLQPEGAGVGNALHEEMPGVLEGAGASDRAGATADRARPAIDRGERAESGVRPLLVELGAEAGKGALLGGQSGARRSAQITAATSEVIPPTRVEYNL